MTAGGSLRPGKEFERRVADVYRALGYQVTPNLQLDGNQSDLVAHRHVEGGPTLKLIVECKDEKKAIGIKLVNDFIARIISEQAGPDILSGVMVSSSGFTQHARQAAAKHGHIQLLTWEQLAAHLLDVRHQLERFVADYENSPIYRQYLPLSVEPLSWSTFSPRKRSGLTLDAILKEWMGARELTDQAPNALFILGDFGAGKTTLVNSIQYERAKAYLAGRDTRVPLYVALREFRQSQDLTALLRGSFRDAYYRDPPADLLWQRIQSGHFYILFDGFDEMVERSDPSRRVDLFHELLAVLRSRSPSVVTSRPSYFVERGELDGLIRTLNDQEADLTEPLPSKSEIFDEADRLRRGLVERHRESRPGRADRRALGKRDAQLVRLLPLDRRRVQQLVELRRDELARAGATPEDLMDLIDRIYDLADLATRPLLLTMIIDSVIIGGLDPKDTDTRYGASGLYEIYTRAKLDLDLAKGVVRRGGLTLHARRTLAEALAVQMYEANTLEVDFHLTLERLLAGATAREEVEASGLTGEEIATDFATCSFVTLDQDGRCRFVHKSFREFFVARVLREALGETPSLMSQWLDREVLYFLGGFAPTQPEVGEGIWDKFNQADPLDRVVRRNALVAFLYTRPDHDLPLLKNGEIFEASFGRLGFTGTRMVDSAWSDCTIASLELRDATWKAVDIRESHIVEMTLNESDICAGVASSTIEQLHSERATAQIDLTASSLDACTLNASSATLDVKSSHVGSLRGFGCSLVLNTAKFDASVGSLMIKESFARLGGQAPATVHAERSVVVFEGVLERTGSWTLERSVLALGAETRSGRISTLGSTAQIAASEETDSIVLASEGIAAALLPRMLCGVFGTLAANTTRFSLTMKSVAWGVLDVGTLFEDLALPVDREEPGCRFGDLLLVRPEWYRRECSQGGRLAALHDLEDLTAQPRADAAAEVEDLLAPLRPCFEKILEQPWKVLSL